jgi:hypothetical protein
MNPFVNPKKRDISLPNGCKNLLDVLRGPDLTAESTMGVSLVSRLTLFILLRAHVEQAMELVVGTPTVSGDVSIRYRVGDVWHDILPSCPSVISSKFVVELTRMAKIPEGQFPCEGILEVNFEEGDANSNLKSKWTLKIMSMDGECVLTRIPA